MPIRRYRRDPRTKAQEEADTRVLERFERGEFLKVAPSVERAALEYVKTKNVERKELVAKLGRELGEFRRIHGISQEEVARAIGTQKTNVSRIESGRHGGLTIERFFAILEAIRSAVGRTEFDPLLPGPRFRDSPVIHDETLERFRSPASCLEASGS